MPWTNGVGGPSSLVFLDSFSFRSRLERAAAGSFLIAIICMHRVGWVEFKEAYVVLDHESLLDRYYAYRWVCHLSSHEMKKII